MLASGSVRPSGWSWASRSVCSWGSGAEIGPRGRAQRWSGSLSRSRRAIPTPSCRTPCWRSRPPVIGWLSWVARPAPRRCPRSTCAGSTTSRRLRCPVRCVPTGPSSRPTASGSPSFEARTSGSSRSREELPSDSHRPSASPAAGTGREAVASTTRRPGSRACTSSVPRAETRRKSRRCSTARRATGFPSCCPTSRPSSSRRVAPTRSRSTMPGSRSSRSRRGSGEPWSRVAPTRAS